ncbi:hypothetical protein VTO42DRAFT_2861 [Malbranchea cinnamomea]
MVFHSAADSLHRPPTAQYARGYGTIANHGKTRGRSESDGVVRRSVTLYDPRHASLFKLSRLRVPRYRQFLSTLSYAILLGLFLAVIHRRSLKLTGLELVFWFWSAGFMLDEIVGFNEQGFSLYLMSFWNTFDVGILMLLVIYGCLRIYSVAAPPPNDQDVANLAYDVLAASAVLLLPRLFSVLDHYRYFSQLLVAFRLMLTDLAVVLILIIIACSGFFVAFTSSFGSENSPGSIAYALFQMLMGFTPAAWTLWDNYNVLGKAILTLFLFVCHFLVVTILISVLTNSFMAIASNANEEHQFVFAVNTISMIKSDALFSYVAPANILAWAIAPLRFVMPFRTFIRVNRTVIKATHFPILFTIYLYERVILRSAMLEPADLVETRWRPELYQASRRLREPSIATQQKDLALEEVFRRPLGRRRRQQLQTHAERHTNIVVNNWMQDMHPEPPEEQDHDVVEALERGNVWKAPRLRRRKYLPRSLRDFTETTRSVASDPEEYPAKNFLRPHLHCPRNVLTPEGLRNTQPTDVDGDDELSTNDEDSSKGKHTVRSHAPPSSNVVEEWSATTLPLAAAASSSSTRPSTAKLVPGKGNPRRPRTPQRHRDRTFSSATVLYNPLDQPTDSDARTAERASQSPQSGSTTPNRHRQSAAPTSARAMHLPMSGRGGSPGDIVPFPRPSSFTMGLGSDLGDNKAVGGGFVGGLPASFTTQMYPSLRHARGRGVGRGRGLSISDGDGDGAVDRDMLSKLVLARMKTLEESFQEVIREVKDLKRESQRSSPASSETQQEPRTSGPPSMPRRSSDKNVLQKKKNRQSQVLAPQCEPVSDGDGRCL